MIDDRWNWVAVPILEWVHENGDPDGRLSVGQIAAGTGLRPDDVSTELESLCDAGYLVGEVRKYFGSSSSAWNLFGCSLSERGLRMVRGWPTDNPYDALIELIERQSALMVQRQTGLIERQTELIERLTELIERQVVTTPDERALPRHPALGSGWTDIGKITVARLLVQIDHQRVSILAHMDLSHLDHLSRSRLVTVVKDFRGRLRPSRIANASTFREMSNRLRFSRT